jgi:6-phosphofructokinase 1
MASIQEETRKIGVLTGGGDAPGLNAAIRAVVKSAAGQHGMTVIGIENSFEGLLGDTVTRELRPVDVRGLLPRGGTVLGARNKGGFVKRDSDGISHPDEVYGEAIANLDRLGIEALIVIGGEGTLTIAAEFARRGVTIIGVPKTIDNDLAATELTFGFATALDIATEALDRLHTTAESHDRVMILEVMGRNTGWIALLSSIEGGADVILIPEIPFSLASIVRKIEDRERNRSNFTIIVAAEGASAQGSSPIYQVRGGQRQEGRLGGVAAFCALELEQLTGKETRCVVLGHLQRGGRPNAFDRMLATNFGTAAVRALVRGESGVMVSLRASEIETVPLAAAIANLKTVPVEGRLIESAHDIGISFGAPVDPISG